MKKNALILAVLFLVPVFLSAQTSLCSLPGDVNGSGSVDIVDALSVAQASVGLEPSNYNSSCADVNCDGIVNIVDGLLVAQYYVGLLAAWPCPTLTPTPDPITGEYIISIAAGSSSAVGSFAEDQFFSGGETYSNTNTVSVSQLTDKPAPPELFNNERYGDVTYTIPGFSSGVAYTVNLYFAETYLDTSGSRVFNVSINDNMVLANFDIYASAGGQNIAVYKSFITLADSRGQIVIKLSSVTENPKINGISVQAGSIPTAAPTPKPTPDPSCVNCSPGCGKDLTDLRSGTYSISSAGLSRKYIIDIPANYDKNKPYRLIFGMHMMGGNMNTMVNNNYYGLKTYAQQTGVQCIFVAPDGYSDSSPWRINDDKDHVFFADMLKLFKEKLCIDTSRVFSAGFSYGAMVTYSLSLAFQDDLRAVACYAPANWNIYLPNTPRKPIAYYQTTGTADDLCSWVNNEGAKRGGKFCVLRHLEDNGCNIPSNIPLATSGTHVTTEFSGCNEDYPVVFGSFNGGHTENVRDPGSNVNWVAKETWDFFMRF